MSATHNIKTALGILRNELRIYNAAEKHLGDNQYIEFADGQPAKADFREAKLHVTAAIEALEHAERALSPGVSSSPS